MKQQEAPLNKEKIISELSQQIADYSTAKAHSEGLDNAFGFKCREIEYDLARAESGLERDNQNFWIGLDLQALQTPYSEFVQIIRELRPSSGDTWIDLGAGYGRLGLVLSFLDTGVKFTGFEAVVERVREANRVIQLYRCGGVRVEAADIAADDFSIPKADVFFIYDFGSRDDVFKVLKKLGALAAERPIVVVARGRGVKHWILADFPWLGEVNPPQHFTHWSIFRS